MKTLPAPPHRAAARALAGLVVCFGLAACSQKEGGSGVPAQIAVTQPQTPPVAVQPTVIQPPALELLDGSLSLTVLPTGELRMRPGRGGRVWLRVRLPNGKISPETLSADCLCTLLGGPDGVPQLALQLVPGLSFETALAQGGPWTVAALTP